MSDTYICCIVDCVAPVVDCVCGLFYHQIYRQWSIDMGGKGKGKGGKGKGGFDDFGKGKGGGGGFGSASPRTGVTGSPRRRGI
jgi:hypothetical protein